MTSLGAFRKLGAQRPDIECIDTDRWHMWLSDPYDAPDCPGLSRTWTASIHLRDETTIDVDIDGFRKCSLTIANELSQADEDRLRRLGTALYNAVAPCFLDLLRERRAAVEDEWRRNRRTPPTELSVVKRLEASAHLLRRERYAGIAKDDALVRLVLRGRIQVSDALRMCSTSEALTVALSAKFSDYLETLGWTEVDAWDRLDDRQRNVVRRAWDADERIALMRSPEASDVRTSDQSPREGRIQLWIDPLLSEIAAVVARHQERTLSQVIQSQLLQFVASGPPIDLIVAQDERGWRANVLGLAEENFPDIDHLVRWLHSSLGTTEFRLSVQFEDSGKRTSRRHVGTITAADVPSAVRSCMAPV